MAGEHYDLAPFYDPRPFYDVTVDQKYVFLDDMFNPGKKDPPFIESAIKEKGKGKAGGGGEGGGKKKNDGEGQKAEEKSKIQIIELNVNLCCDSCVRKVKEALYDVDGVETVDWDQYKKKVFVRGSVKPEIVLKRVKKAVKKNAELVVPKK